MVFQLCLTAVAHTAHWWQQQQEFWSFIWRTLCLNYSGLWTLASGVMADSLALGQQGAEEALQWAKLFYTCWL